MDSPGRIQYGGFQMVGEKTCYRCGKTKPHSDFVINRRVPDGHSNWCKECEKEYREIRGSKAKKIPEDFAKLMEEAIEEYDFSTIKVSGLWNLKEKEFKELGYKITDVTKGIGKLYLQRNGFVYRGDRRWIKK